MIGIHVRRPDLLSGIWKGQRTRANLSTDEKICTRGTPLERYSTRRDFEHLRAVLVGMIEIECGVHVRLEAVDGELSVSGNITVWSADLKLIAEEVVSQIDDIGSRIASTAESALLVCNIVRSMA